MSEGEGGNERDGVQTDNDDVYSKGPDVLESLLELWLLQTAFACTNRGIPTCSGGLQAPAVGRGVFGIRLAPFPWIDGGLDHTGRVHQRWMDGRDDEW